MKLLLDENLSYRLVAQLASAFPGSVHVDSVGLHAQADSAIWNSLVITASRSFQRTTISANSAFFAALHRK